MRKLIYGAFNVLAAREIARFEKATHNPRDAQLERLQDILSRARATAFGRDHGLSSAQTYQDFRQAVPIGDYDRFRPYIDRIVAGEQKILTTDDPFMLATTSGTTGSQKYIPITPSYMREFGKASTTSCHHLLRHFPRLPEGCSLTVFSPAEEGRTAGGLPYGAISGGLYMREPWALKRYIAPIPYEVFLIKDYEVRYYCLLRAALALPISTFYTLNPSTIALLARRLKLYGGDLAKDLHDGSVSAPGSVPAAAIESLGRFMKPRKDKARALAKLVEQDQCVPHKAWPELQVVCCWTKAAAAFYLADFPDFFGSTPICDITYGASEGRGTVLVGPDKQAVALRTHFYEFVPEDEIDSANPTVLLADELSAGSKYYILFTTSGGLYRYHINDVVKVTGFHNRTPLIEFQYKGGNIFSFTGEKITELQVTEAMARTLAELSLKLRFFTVIPEFRPAPHYRLWVEPLPGGEKIIDSIRDQLSAVFDRQLGLSNIEYRAKRDSLRLDQVVLEMIAPGSYEAYRKALVATGVPDSQIKLSHLNPKPETRAYFEALLDKHRLAPSTHSSLGVS